MANKVSQALRRKIRHRAKGHCEYCQASEELTGQVFHVDHVIPRVRGGKTVMDNLCLACPACNGAKLDRINGVDPESGNSTVLFNPRNHHWNEHFRWDKEGAILFGLSDIGRATINTLRMNRPLSIAVRRIWVAVHRHPPVEL